MKLPQSVNIYPITVQGIYSIRVVCYLGGDLVESEDGEDTTVTDAGGALDCVCVQALHRLIQPGAVVEVEP